MGEALIFLVVFLELFGLNLGLIDLGKVIDFQIIEKHEVKLDQIAINKLPTCPCGEEVGQKPDLEASNYLVVDYDSSRVLISQKPNEKRPIASLTKLMTATIALEELGLDQVLTVPQTVTQTTGSKLWLAPSSKFTVRQLLKGVLIRSANDCAYVIEKGHDKINGEKSFAKKMNQKARSLGMKNTKYTEATGLSEKNKSNLKDLVTLSKYVLKKPFIRQTVKIYQDAVMTTTGFRFPVTSTNKLLRTESDIYGVKTGYLEEAGQCLIALAKRNNHQVLVLVLGASTSEGRFWQTKQLIDWTYENYKW